MLERAIKAVERVFKEVVNPYLNTDYNNLYNFDLEEGETLSNIESTRIKYYTI